MSNNVSRYRYGILTASLLCSVSVSFAVEPIYVFLLAGQSNMSGDARISGLSADLKAKQEKVIIHLDPATDGDKSRKGTWMTLEPGFGWYADRFGPELLFAKTVTKKYPDAKLALIKSSVAGTDLDKQWRPPSSGGTVGKLYSGFIKEIDNALATLDTTEYTPTIMGVLWMQGEADAMNASMANNYETNLKNFITDIRKKAGVEDLPFIAANIDEQTTWKDFKIVNNAMNSLATKMTNVHTFPTKGFATDKIHYQTAGMISLGEAFANAVINAKYLDPKVAIGSVHPAAYTLQESLAGTRMFDLSGRKIQKGRMQHGANNLYIMMYRSEGGRSYRNALTFSRE